MQNSNRKDMLKIKHDVIIKPVSVFASLYSNKWYIYSQMYIMLFMNICMIFNSCLKFNTIYVFMLRLLSITYGFDKNRIHYKMSFRIFI